MLGCHVGDDVAVKIGQDDDLDALVEAGRGHYADPNSLIRAVGMLAAHIGYGDRREKLDKALDICTITERKKVVTTFPEGASAAEYTDYLLETLEKL